MFHQVQSMSVAVCSGAGLVGGVAAIVSVLLLMILLAWLALR
jgi:hypothetical protein